RETGPAPRPPQGGHHIWGGCAGVLPQAGISAHPWLPGAPLCAAACRMG
ncbi:unnamed protein product, partial [Heterosigma akashiwo]